MARIPEIVAAAELAAGFNDGVRGFANNGKKNHYRCRDCHFQIVTIDREPGVTPFLIKCDNCGGEAQSSGYRNVPAFIAVTHEWYRPDTFDGLSGAVIDHIKNGGLIKRPIAPGDPA